MLDPRQTIDAYTTDIEEGNWKDAYDKFTQANKNNINKDDFVLFENVNQIAHPLISITVDQGYGSHSGEIKLDGNKYKDSYYFYIEEVTKDLYENQETKNSYKRFVVWDNGQWKIEGLPLVRKL